jgi:hypothetical protein
VNPSSCFCVLFQKKKHNPFFLHFVLGTKRDIYMLQNGTLATYLSVVPASVDRVRV